ncbi:MAG: SDR family oxidoreductase [Burkholderiaceae bacterium]
MSPAASSSNARTVLVTGAARRLGREICLAFARAGWDVVAHHRHSEDEAHALQADIERIGRHCHLLQADLRAPDAGAKVLHLGRTLAGALPHCIVNNASVFEADDALSASADGLLDHFSTNTIAPLLLANGLARALAEGGRPTAGQHSVVHVLDQKVHNLNPDYFSYTVSKLALAQSVALQAQALAPWVRVCGLSPGLMYLSGPQTPDNFERASRVNLLRQPVDPADVARCALFIAENVSLNGATLQADNGQHLVALDRDVMFAVELGPHAPPLARGALVSQTAEPPEAAPLRAVQPRAGEPGAAALGPEGASAALGRPGGVRGAP